MENDDASPGIFREFVLFIRERKAWWLAPVLVMLFVVGGLIVLGGSSVLSPFIYSLF
jgi:hypothetical protein